MKKLYLIKKVEQKICMEKVIPLNAEMQFRITCLKGFKPKY